MFGSPFSICLTTKRNHLSTSLQLIFGELHDGVPWLLCVLCSCRPFLLQAVRPLDEMLMKCGKLGTCVADTTRIASSSRRLTCHGHGDALGLSRGSVTTSRHGVLRLHSTPRPYATGLSKPKSSLIAAASKLHHIRASSGAEIVKRACAPVRVRKPLLVPLVVALPDGTLHIAFSRLPLGPCCPRGAPLPALRSARLGQRVSHAV